MTGPAALPMYDDGGALWARLRDALPDLLGAPAPVPDEDALLSLWRDPGLLLADVCWGPVEARLIPPLRVLARHDYGGLPGGEGPRYRSALVKRGGATADPPAPAPGPGQGACLPDLRGTRLAANAPHSRSGWGALVADAGPLPEPLWTGSHAASIAAVTDGRADAAAIDARSWALALAAGQGRGLVVAGWTAPRPGLFFATGARTAPETAARLTAALIAAGAYPPE